jgi:DNA-binding response OmpR family regulator
MPSILLIEDDELFRDALANALTEHGYTVTQAEDGEQGVKLFRAAPADLVITDIVMPNKEGIATVVELRRAHPKLGIIAMSGGAAHEPELYLKIAGTFGATRTLKKPFDLRTLLKAIEEVLAETGEGKPPS